LIYEPNVFCYNSCFVIAPVIDHQSNTCGLVGIQTNVHA
jgi:hypothetical protein